MSKESAQAKINQLKNASRPSSVSPEQLASVLQDILDVSGSASLGQSIEIATSEEIRTKLRLHGLL